MPGPGSNWGYQGARGAAHRHCKAEIPGPAQAQTLRVYFQARVFAGRRPALFFTSWGVVYRGPECAGAVLWVLPGSGIFARRCHALSRNGAWSHGGSTQTQRSLRVILPGSGLRSTSLRPCYVEGGVAWRRNRARRRSRLGTFGLGGSSLDVATPSLRMGAWSSDGPECAGADSSARLGIFLRDLQGPCGGRGPRRLRGAPETGVPGRRAPAAKAPTAAEVY